MKARRAFTAAVLSGAVLQISLGAASTAKELTLPSATDGSLVRLSDYAGRVVLINWWRTSCAWSQQESQRLAALYQKYRASGLEIVGISDDTADTVARIPAYMKAHGVTWRIALNDQGEVVRDLVPEHHQDTPQNFL